jgi:hypothetical protein
VAWIRFGFDREEELAGPFLDPLHRHSPCAREMLDLVERLVLSDPRYVARLERHHEIAQRIQRDGPVLTPSQVAEAIARKRARRHQRQRAEKARSQSRKSRAK